MDHKLARGERAVHWIEEYCVYPSGPERGQHVRLSQEQRRVLRQIYDHPGNPHPPLFGSLAAFVALLHICGPEAKQREFRPALSADIFSVWSATGPDLRAVLKRDGERILCPQLGTHFPVAA